MFPLPTEQLVFEDRARVDHAGTGEKRAKVGGGINRKSERARIFKT